MEIIFLTILLAGATPPDVRHPEAGLQPSIEVCETKRDKARAQGHLAKCVVFDRVKIRERDPNMKATLYVWPKGSYWDDELKQSDFLTIKDCKRAEAKARDEGHIADCREAFVGKPLPGPGPCADCGGNPEFPAA